MEIRAEIFLEDYLMFNGTDGTEIEKDMQNLPPPLFINKQEGSNLVG